MATPTVNRPRTGYTRSMGGMVGALVAVLGLVAVMGGFAWLLHRPVDNPVKTVNFRAVLAVAREQAPFHVLAPDPVPAGLRATNVSWDGVGGRVSWHVGFLTSGQDYIGLYQGNGPTTAFLDAATPATDRGAPVTVRGKRWMTLTNSDQGETALVRTVNGVTTVVTGTAPEPQLASFIAHLR
jgi:Protein of unknown function (DUF4245)